MYASNKFALSFLAVGAQASLIYSGIDANEMKQSHRKPCTVQFKNYCPEYWYGGIIESRIKGISKKLLKNAIG